MNLFCLFRTHKYPEKEKKAWHIQKKLEIVLREPWAAFLNIRYTSSLIRSVMVLCMYSPCIQIYSIIFIIASFLLIAVKQSCGRWNQEERSNNLIMRLCQTPRLRYFHFRAFSRSNSRTSSVFPRSFSFTHAPPVFYIASSAQNTGNKANRKPIAYCNS